ncbi:MAG: hypothetical protein ACOC9W_06455 [Persicimonas sp.]
MSSTSAQKSAEKKDDQKTGNQKTGDKRGWKDDSLSVFLLAAALILGGMYLYDQWQASTLDEQMSRANQIQASFGIDGADCQVSCTGQRGEVLVFDCGGLAAPELATAASSVDRLTDELVHFNRVVFLGAEQQLHCPPEPTGWPDGCQRQPLPDIAE